MRCCLPPDRSRTMIPVPVPSIMAQNKPVRNSAGVRNRLTTARRRTSPPPSPLHRQRGSSIRITVIGRRKKAWSADCQSGTGSERKAPGIACQGTAWPGQKPPDAGGQSGPRLEMTDSPHSIPPEAMANCCSQARFWMRHRLPARYAGRIQNLSLSQVGRRRSRQQDGKNQQTVRHPMLTAFRFYYS